MPALDIHGLPPVIQILIENSAPTNRITRP